MLVIITGYYYYYTKITSLLAMITGNYNYSITHNSNYPIWL